MPTETIAHYRIGAPLGQGAMGEVYRATDTRLGREVAIKIIAPALAGDRARMDSFVREAQVLASLNHPNIAAIYGVEEQALVMELVEGATLADRLTQGPLPVEEALAVARQIADALAAAHEKGIVHRDLKPANIKITPDGVVKLLDFGVAKAAARAATSGADVATIAATLTASETIIGTPAYMAPEQARGLPVDKRADIWAFGVIVYEMLTGARLFAGETTTDVMAAVLREDPDLSRVPPAVRPLLRQCLEKDPKKRLRDIGDAMAIVDAAASVRNADAAAVPSRRRALVPWAIAAAALLALAAVSLRPLVETQPAARAVRLQTSLPEGLTFTPNALFAISPDGARLAFAAVGDDGVPRIWLQDLATLEAHALPVETPPNPALLVWSPDSRQILYPHDRKLKRVPVDGGPPEIVADEPGPFLGGVWDANGNVIYGTLAGVAIVPAASGDKRMLTKSNPPNELHAVYSALPDGRFLYSRGGGAGSRAVYARSIDTPPDQDGDTPILKTDFGATFVPAAPGTEDGHLLFVRDESLMAQRFDPDRLQLAGEAASIAKQLFTVSSAVAGAAYYSVSDEGTLIYRTGTVAGLARQLTWYGREGKPLGALDERARYVHLKLSPDGSRLVAARIDVETGTNTDIWITDLGSGASTRLTFSPEADQQPTWSPDGREIAWVGVRDGVPGLFRKQADGSGEEERLYTFKSPGTVIVSDWSPAGFLVFSGGGDIFALPVGPGTNASREPIPLVRTPAREFGPDLSPDSRWLVYISDESGRQELYVQPFAPSAGTAGGVPAAGKWMVSKDGTLGLARWRRDARELFFVSGEGELMSIDVTATPVFKAGPPRSMFPLPRPFLGQTQTPGALADVTPDGQRVLIAMPSIESTRPDLSVVLNWQAAAR